MWLLQPQYHRENPLRKLKLAVSLTPCFIDTNHLIYRIVKFYQIVLVDFNNVLKLALLEEIQNEDNFMVGGTICVPWNL